MPRRVPSHRARNAAALLPALGALALLPPVVGLFAGASRPFGVPLVVLYLFGVWVLLVLLAAALSTRLHEPDALAPEPRPEPEPESESMVDASATAAPPA